MIGHIIVEHETGRRWIYVPEAHIQFQHGSGGKLGLVLNAFRTDGWYKTKGGAIPTTDWLTYNHEFIKTLEVPDPLVAFAVESERERMESVGGIEKLLREATQNSRTEGAPRTEEQSRRGFKALLSELGKSHNDQKEEREYAYAQWVKTQLDALGAHE